MAAGGGDELICDFAEYYNVLDWRALPLPLAAVLAAGLPEGSRSVRRLAGELRGAVPSSGASRYLPPRGKAFASGADFREAWAAAAEIGGEEP